LKPLPLGILATDAHRNTQTIGFLMRRHIDAGNEELKAGLLQWLLLRKYL
ncbi:MAG: hypothetical protein JRF53_04540, partial [Deltaproteobacteria bacterium]|nr:hypothetical protein [Deltaproteobacteria bacterium]